MQKKTQAYSSGILNIRVFPDPDLQDWSMPDLRVLLFLEK